MLAYPDWYTHPCLGTTDLDYCTHAHAFVQAYTVIAPTLRCVCCRGPWPLLLILHRVTEALGHTMKPAKSGSVKVARYVWRCWIASVETQ